MNRVFVNLLTTYWGLPLWLRRISTPILAAIIKKSNNSRYRDVIEASTKLAGINTPLQQFVYQFVINGISPLEYSLFNFGDKTLKERDKYISDAYRTQLQKRIIGIDLFKRDLIDKFNFYQLNKNYFKRQAIKLDKTTNLATFADFAKRHGEIFLKVNAGSFGYNAHRFKYTYDLSLENEFAGLGLSDGAEWIAEAIVSQSAEIAVWNETSVNTIRIPSFISRDKKSCTIFRPFIRTGRKGAVVDNAGAGGIFAVIDEKTGVIITDGADESFNRYTHHPDSHIQYKGWQIPYWDELLTLAEEAHKHMPDHKYIAYDFALTDTGWVMIEGNWGQYVCQQTATQQGAKESFKHLLCEY